MKNGSGACVENFNSLTASGMTPMNERGKRKEGSEVSEVKVMTMTTVDDDTTVGSHMMIKRQFSTKYWLFQCIT